MSNMLSVIRDLLLKIISNIDAGNSNLTEQEELDLVKILKRYTNKDRRMSKYSACKYLGVSRATFDNYVRAGKIPGGRKEEGFNEKSWSLKELNRFKSSKEK